VERPRAAGDDVEKHVERRTAGCRRSMQVCASMNHDTGEGDDAMSPVLTPTVKSLEDERTELLAALRLTEDELRERAADFLLTPTEARALRRLDEIDFLLGDDD
jgi:hypothetical protein